MLARLPAHLLGANDESAARDLLCTADFCALKCRAGMVSELVADFAAAHRRWGGAVWEDFHEALQGNAHLLRAHPECFVQQFANARDSSAAARSVADLVAADRAGTALVQWRNKPQHRPICVATFRCPGVEYWAVSASPSGARLAVGASDKCVHILDRDGNEVGLLVGHGSDVCTVAFHPFAGEYMGLACGWVQRRVRSGGDRCEDGSIGCVVGWYWYWFIGWSVGRLVGLGCVDVGLRSWGERQRAWAWASFWATFDMEP